MRAPSSASPAARRMNGAYRTRQEVGKQGPEALGLVVHDEMIGSVDPDQLRPGRAFIGLAIERPDHLFAGIFVGCVGDGQRRLDPRQQGPCVGRHHLVDGPRRDRAVRSLGVGNEARPEGFGLDEGGGGTRLAGAPGGLVHREDGIAECGGTRRDRLRSRVRREHQAVEGQGIDDEHAPGRVRMTGGEQHRGQPAHRVAGDRRAHEMIGLDV